MDQIKLAVTGATGRMGSSVIRHIDKTEGLELYGATERQDHPDLAKDVGGLLLGKNIELSLENDLRNVIVGVNAIIDFTLPDASLFHLQVAVEKQIPIVIGTTGFTNEQMETLQELGPQTKTVWSPNMSLGVNLLWKLASQVAGIFGDEYDAEIVEAHHRNKIDAPSGTARRLAKLVAEAWEKNVDDIADYGRHGNTGVREYGRIGVHAVRGGDIVGEHKLSFLGPGEELYIGHRVHNRDNFVKGAIRAAAFLQKAEKGLYSMWDVMNLR